METIAAYQCACGRRDTDEAVIRGCERQHRSKASLVPGAQVVVRLDGEGWGGRTITALFQVVQQDGDRYLVERIQGRLRCGFWNLGERRWVPYTQILRGCGQCGSVLWTTKGVCLHCGAQVAE